MPKTHFQSGFREGATSTIVNKHDLHSRIVDFSVCSNILSGFLQLGQVLLLSLFCISPCSWSRLGVVIVFYLRVFVPIKH